MITSRFLLFWIILMIIFPSARANRIYSNGNGNWTSSSTWLRNGSASTPTCADTVYIQASHIITESAQLDFSACSSLSIIIEGTLQFTNGNKLDLPCGSFVDIKAGGLVKKSTPGGGNSTYIEICNVTFWNAGMGPLSGPIYLPVTLLQFDAENAAGKIKLSWSTASESDNDYFKVERSTDGVKWISIAETDGAGTTNTLSKYSCMDNDPARGVNYYRLMQVDYNAQVHYFDPVSISFAGNPQFTFIINPCAINNINISYLGNTAINAHIYLADINGKLIYQNNNFKMESGNNNLQAQIDNIPSQICILKITTPEEIFISKVLIQQ